MEGKGFRSVAWILLAAAGAGVIGYFSGLRQGQAGGLKMLQTEAVGNLTQRIETLSHLRLGEMSQAIARLEEEADQLTLSIAANEGADKRGLMTAKAYRNVVSPSPARAKELQAVFAPLPDPKPSECGAALQRLLKRESNPSNQK